MSLLIKIPHTLLNVFEPGGMDSNAFNMATYARVAGATTNTRTDTDGTVKTFLTDIKPELTPIGVLGIALSLGGDVEGYQAFLKLDDKTALVPEGVPNRTYVDENNVEQVKTWGEWATGTVHTGTDGKFYIETSNGTRYYHASELAPVLANLVSVADFQAAQPTEEV